MSRLTGILAGLLLLLGITAGAVRATEADAQRALVQKFITAYFRNDSPTVRACLPAQHAALFTRYPFTATPVLAAPKVRKNQALVEFSGPVADAKFLGKGGVLLSKHGNKWQVRQVLFYNKVPGLLNLPNRSMTAIDRGYEATVAEIARQFIAHWKAGNTAGMLGLWYDWAKDNAKPVAGLQMSDFKTSVAKTRWNEPYVYYAVKLDYKLLGRFPVSLVARGGMVLVKNGAAWKVRANSFILTF